MGQLGHSGQSLAKSHAGYGRRNSLHLPLDLGRRVRFGIERLVLWRGTIEEEEDARPGFAKPSRRGRSRGRWSWRESIGQGETKRSQPADAQEVAPRQAVAQPPGETAQADHRKPIRQRLFGSSVESIRPS